jgi:hypothetical protein
MSAELLSTIIIQIELALANRNSGTLAMPYLLSFSLEAKATSC